VLEEADACAVVPMVGMVESLNVSVAAALMLHEARRGRVAALVRAWEHPPAGSADPVAVVMQPAAVPQCMCSAAVALMLRVECAASC
jgi:hypothetical protein